MFLLYPRSILMIKHLSEYCFAEEENHNTLGYFWKENTTSNQVAVEYNLWKVLPEFNAPGQKTNKLMNKMYMSLKTHCSRES